MFKEINKVEDLKAGMLYEGRLHISGIDRWEDYLRFSLVKDPELIEGKDGSRYWKVYIGTPLGNRGEGFDHMTITNARYIDDVYAIEVLETCAFDINLREDDPGFSTMTYKFEIQEKIGEFRKSVSWMPLHEKQKARVARGLPPNEPFIPEEKKKKTKTRSYYYDARPKEANRVFLCIFIWLPVLFGVVEFVPISTGVTLYNVIMILRWLYFGED